MQRSPAINGSKRCEVGTRCAVYVPVYTQEMLNYLSANRALPHSLLTVKFNKKFETNKSIIAIHSICKRMGWFTGRTGCFEKDHKPWNTGTKGICKKNKGCFPKGNKPKNWKPIGSERIDVNGYILVKTAEPNVWQFKHLIVWTAAHGKPEKGHVIQFKDNNRLNCALDNLEEVSRAVSLYLNRNNYAKTPMEFKPSLRAVAEIVVKISERRRRKTGT